MLRNEDPAKEKKKKILQELTEALRAAAKTQVQPSIPAAMALERSFSPWEVNQVNKTI